MGISDFRKDYERGELDEDATRADPFAQFGAWLQEAIESGVPEPTAMTLATVGQDWRPSTRIVLLKEFDERGFVFFTNYESAKGAHLEANPRAALVSFWADLERQVRVTGTVARVAAAVSDDYFHSRPLDSQLGAWASPQSRPIAGRGVLEARMAAVTAEYTGREIPRPAHWGGYEVTASTIEFWQGRPNRLHDRLRYTREASGWRLERLAP